VDQCTQAQIEVIQELGARLSALRVRFWLRGGWAVDFMLGRITRSHDDVDVVVWHRHRRRVHQALSAAGFSLLRDTDTQTDYRARGQVVSLCYLERDDKGRIVTQGIPVWLWLDGALGRRLLHLAGMSAYVVGPRQLLWEKESYEQGTGRPPRPKDLQSMSTLRAIIAAESVSSGDRGC
jgi:hypothetical protein